MDRLKPHQAKALRALYERRVDRRQFVSPPLARALTELSRDTGRRIGILIDRLGEVEYVVIGDAHRVDLPDLGPRRAGAARFRGVRLLLSNLRPEGLTEDDRTDLALLQLDAVATIRVQADGLPGEVQLATLLPPTGEGEAVDRIEAALSESFPGVRFVRRASDYTQKMEGFRVPPQPEPKTRIRENGVVFEVEP
jgi:GTP-binding protein HflX